MVSELEGRILQVSVVINSGSSEQTVDSEKGRPGSKCPPITDLPSHTRAGYTSLPMAPALRGAPDRNPRAPGLTLGTTKSSKNRGKTATLKRRWDEKYGD